MCHHKAAARSIASFVSPGSVSRVGFSVLPALGAACVSDQAVRPQTQPFLRHLSAGEIASQLLTARRELDCFPVAASGADKISNVRQAARDEWMAWPDGFRLQVVFMGQGEPLYNFRNVSSAVKQITDKRMGHIAPVRLSRLCVVFVVRGCDGGASTEASLHQHLWRCTQHGQGWKVHLSPLPLLLVFSATHVKCVSLPGVSELGVNLALSLHAPNDKVRAALFVSCAATWSPVHGSFAPRLFRSDPRSCPSTTHTTWTRSWKPVEPT